MRVYGDSISGNCLKVRWVLDRLKIPYEWAETGVTTGETRTPEFLALNPAGQVPLVVFDDGRTLAQSGAIIVHFAEGTDLIPSDSFERARMFEWMFWEQYSHEPYVAVRRFLMAYLRQAEADLDPKLFDRGSGALRRLEDGLAAGPYLAGDRLSLADVALVAYTRMAGDGGFDLNLYPQIQAWIVRVDADLGLSPYRGIEAAAPVA
jgi:glutathione S-transferase